MKKIVILSLVALFMLGTVSATAAPADPPTKKELRKEQKRERKEAKKEAKRLKKLQKQNNSDGIYPPTPPQPVGDGEFDPADATEGDASKAV